MAFSAQVLFCAKCTPIVQLSAADRGCAAFQALHAAQQSGGREMLTASWIVGSAKETSVTRAEFG